MEKPNLYSRFWKNVVKGPSCWGWSGYFNQHGYGMIGYGSRGTGRTFRAHRVSAVLHGLVDQLEPDICVLHLCDNPPCTNPAHLKIGTKKENSRDMIRKGRGKGRFTKGRLDPRSNGGAWNTRKTHCPAGHPYAGENLVRTGGNKRQCRTCINERARRLRQRPLPG